MATERRLIARPHEIAGFLAGTQTQFRRAVKLRDPSGTYSAHADDGWPESADEFGQWHRDRCPYGQPGDRLWVRETCRAHELTDKEAEDDTYSVVERLGLELPPYGLDGVVYLADGSFREIENTREASDEWVKLNAYRRQSGAVVPAIHMPRWASRITLEVTGVRVERLQEISHKDSIAEGFGHHLQEKTQDAPNGKTWGRLGFSQLWDIINGKSHPWESNPWVWVCEVRKAVSGG